MRYHIFGLIAALVILMQAPAANAASLSALNQDLSNFETVTSQMAETTSVIDIAIAIIANNIDVTLDQIAFLVSLDVENAVEIINLFAAALPEDQQEAFISELVAVIAATVEGIDQNEAFAALQGVTTVALITPVTFGLTTNDGSCAR